MRVQKMIICLQAGHNSIVCYILLPRHSHSVNIKTESDILCQHKFLSAPDLKSGSVSQFYLYSGKLLQCKEFCTVLKNYIADFRILLWSISYLVLTNNLNYVSKYVCLMNYVRVWQEFGLRIFQRLLCQLVLRSQDEGSLLYQGHLIPRIARRYPIGWGNHACLQHGASQESGCGPVRPATTIDLHNSQPSMADTAKTASKHLYKNSGNCCLKYWGYDWKDPEPSLNE